MPTFLTDTSQNIFSYSFVYEHSKHLFIFRQILHFFKAGGVYYVDSGVL